jgi:hypothetical protein
MQVMKNTNRVFLTLAIAFLLGTSATYAHTKVKCYDVKCRGTSGICISYGGHGGDESGIPGTAETTEKPCPPGSSVLPTHTTFFIHSPTDPNQGMGYINAEISVSGSDADVSIYDDTQVYTNFQDWMNAQ